SVLQHEILTIRGIRELAVLLVAEDPRAVGRVLQDVGFAYAIRQIRTGAMRCQAREHRNRAGRELDRHGALDLFEATVTDRSEQMGEGAGGGESGYEPRATVVDRRMRQCDPARE